MKINFVFILMTFLIATPLFAQDKYLSGPVTESQIREVKIFDLYAERYEPNKEIIQKLHLVKDSVLIDVFMGTWCHDSKREVPALFKVMELTDNSRISVKYTALEYKRRGPKEVIEQNDIKRTPTFIIYKNGKQIGRIIEEVTISMEADLFNIISSN